MLPFLKIPLCFPNYANPDEAINPANVQDGRTQPDNIEDMVRCAEGTTIVMKSGAILITILTIEQLEMYITAYWAEINKQIQQREARNNFKIN